MRLPNDHHMLQALVSECQMPLRTLRLLAGLAAHASAACARGARLLDVLAAASAAAAGDPAVKPRLQALLAAAAAPYFRCWPASENDLSRFGADAGRWPAHKRLADMTHHGSPTCAVIAMPTLWAGMSSASAEGEGWPGTMFRTCCW